MDPRTVEVVLQESDSIVGGIPGFLLCMKNGTLLPNAGVDASNAPPGCVTPLPKNPDHSALTIKNAIENQTGARIGVIIADSRTHAMRLGCSGVAIGNAGITAVIDDRGRSDLFGRKLEVTKRAVADNIASAAELVMGEADECTPAAVIRGLGMPIGDQTGIETIAAEECLFMGVFRKNTGTL
jgi:coenzyme F420-0:L-glutamate ligase